MDFDLLCRRSVLRDFTVTALMKKILELDFSNLQDTFITIKFWNILASF